jgi:hypothetical protein
MTALKLKNFPIPQTILAIGLNGIASAILQKRVRANHGRMQTKMVFIENCLCFAAGSRSHMVSFARGSGFQPRVSAELAGQAVACLGEATLLAERKCMAAFV